MFLFSSLFISQLSAKLIEPMAPAGVFHTSLYSFSLPDLKEDYVSYSMPMEHPEFFFCALK